MSETITSLTYKKILRPILFGSDAETIHEKVLNKWGRIASSATGRRLLETLTGLEDPRLQLQRFGVTFSNPFGLAAGFDKNCAAPHLFDALGFSHIELGTVTARTQAGNDRPRIFRFPSDQALINRMGFPSCGADAFAQKMNGLSGVRAVAGINIGKTKAVSVDDAAGDYIESFEKLKKFGNYFTLNVSSPNTPELRKLQEKERLSALFAAIAQRNTERKPVLVKIAPDLNDSELSDVLQVCLESGISGIIATNTTIGREGLSTATSETGGLSGRPLHSKSVAMVRKISSITENRLPIIGSGGIFGFSDALDFFKAGASLVQIYTGFIYEGPDLVFRLKRELLSQMEKLGVKTFEEFLSAVKSGV